MRISYLGHLNHVGELGQAGDGDDVMVGLELGPEAEGQNANLRLSPSDQPMKPDGWSRSYNDPQVFLWTPDPGPDTDPMTEHRAEK